MQSRPGGRWQTSIRGGNIVTTAACTGPAARPLDGVVGVPGSKSVTNRALVLAALADGRTRLTNAAPATDSRRLTDSLVRLGFDVTLEQDGSVVVEGQRGRIPSAFACLDVGNAGTAARFLVSMVCLGRGRYEIDGSSRMRERPMADLIAALSQVGASISSTHGRLPVIVDARGLQGGVAYVGGAVSSQFLSALLMSAPLARSTVKIVVEGELSSKPYVQMTLEVMKAFGVPVERDGWGSFTILPATYRAVESFAVENDASSATYFWGAAAVAGGKVAVRDISRRSCQGDVGFLDVLEAMGCRVSEREDGTVVESSGVLNGVVVDLRHMPDTAQTLAAIAPFARSATTITGIESARTKECDRVAAVCTELARLGVSVEERPDGMVIQPCQAIRPAVVRTYDDHRMAMAFSLVGLRCPAVAVEDRTCVDKSFPGFFDVLDELRRGNK
jgi:3-phosphoshikimate 1-carboxyvinyltransferase